jgi:hypothetical protein
VWLKKLGTLLHNEVATGQDGLLLPLRVFKTIVVENISANTEKFTIFSDKAVFREWVPLPILLRVCDRLRNTIDDEGVMVPYHAGETEFLKEFIVVGETYKPVIGVQEILHTKAI